MPWHRYFAVRLLSEYKKDCDLRFMVFADDILVMGRRVQSVERAYAKLANHVGEAGLNLSLYKVQNGRFSRASMHYCGWEFARIYVRINENKVEGFKQRIQDCIKTEM